MLQFDKLFHIMEELESFVCQSNKTDLGADQEVATFLGRACYDVSAEARCLSSTISNKSQDSDCSMNIVKVKYDSATPVSECDSENAQYPSLHFLSAQGEMAKIKNEIEKGIDVNAIDKQGLTPLMWAAAHRQKATVHLLLRHHANPNKEGLGGETALLFAASQGQSDIIDQLLNYGADINHIDMNGGTALMYSVYNGFHEVVKKLLEYGADLTIKNENDQTCYNLATTLGNKTVKNIIEEYIKKILKHSNI